MNDSMKGELNAMFGDILNCPLTKETASTYVLLEGIQYVYQEAQEEYRVQEMTLLYEIIPSPEGDGPNIFGSCTCLDFNRGNITAPVSGSHALQRVEKLTPILKDHVKVQPDDEIFVVTWDHGSAFGIFREVPPILPDPIVRAPMNDQLGRYPSLKRFWEKALEQPKFKDLIALKDKQQASFIVQVGHNLYKINPQAENAFFFEEFLRDQKTLNLFRAVKDQNGPARLVFDLTNYESLPSETKDKLLTDEQKEKLVQYLGIYGKLEMVLGDPQVPEILKNRELASIIRNWLGEDRRVSVLLMMNCWMMNLHTLYSLRKRVGYLVAPQGNIDSPGYNYLYILRSIYNSRPYSLTAEQLAINSIEFSHNDFANDRARRLNPIYPHTINNRTIVNIRLDYREEVSPFDQLLDTLKSLIDSIHTMLDQDMPKKALQFLLIYIRALSFDFTEFKALMIDMPNYIYFLSAANTLLQIPVLDYNFGDEADNFHDRAQNKPPLASQRFIGKQCYVLNHLPARANLTGQDPTGYSIFFPKGRINDPNLKDNISDDELLNDYLPNWKRLINRIYNDLIFT